MEFDSMTSDDRRRCVTKTLFQELGDKYEEYGYKLPRLIFWNVCSRTNTIPVVQNELGVNLVSGFSVNTVKMALTGELDPFKALLSVINSERYDIVQKCVEKYYIIRNYSVTVNTLKTIMCGEGVVQLCKVFI